ncbi:MAG: hypothetical protein CVU41_14270 [Chloroflexi bacterium HGW-Chloroflexi-3]|nr:MAG: hypothetical protein CVU41_14270 [Chloroflexi bacterium HGW-Chloroflexi-3]
MQNINLCQRVESIPAGATTRKWVLNDATNSNHHEVVRLEESPLYLQFSWRHSSKDPIQFVGIFQLDLPGLLQQGYVRLENDESNSPEIRLRIKHKNDGNFYIQVNDDKPALLLNVIPQNDSNVSSDIKNQEEKRKLNKNEIDQLIISKQIFLHGIEHSRKSGQINRMIAIHNIHNSIEIIIRTILYHSDKKYSDKKFDELIGEANVVYKDQVGKDFPLIKQMKSLNSQRNMVQHDADDPSENVVEKYSSLTKLFLEEIYQNYFGLDFDEISIINLIENYEIRTLLKLAKENILVNKNKSVIFLKRAFLWGISNIFRIFNSEFSYDYFAGSLSWFDELVTFSDLKLIKDLDGFSLDLIKFQNANEKYLHKRSILTSFQSFENHLGTYFSIIGFGLDIFEYNHFRKMTDKWNTIFSSNNLEKRLAIYWPKKPQEVISDEKLENILNYVSETLFDLQSKGIELIIPEDYKEFFRILSEWDTSKINIHEIDV